MTTATPSPPAARPPAPRPRRPGSATTQARAVDPFRLLRRHMVLLAGTGFAGIVLGVVVHLVLVRVHPLYSGEVLFEVRAGLDDAREIGSHDITHDDLVTRIASTETMLAMAHDTLLKAVKQPDVQSTSWFRNGFVESGTPMLDDAVDELTEDIGRRMIAGTNLFSLKWATASSTDVPIVLNSIARAYLDERARLDSDVYRENTKVFQDELTNTRRDLDDLNQQIQTFIRDHGITTLDDPRSNQLSLAVGDLQKRIAETTAGLNVARTTREQIAAKLEGTIEPTDEDRAQAMASPAARQQEMAVMQLKTDVRTLAEKYRNPDHWSVRTAQNRLRAVEAEYEAKIQEIMRDTLRAQLKVTSDQIERFDKMVAQLEDEYREKDARLRTLAADMATYLEMEQQRTHLNAVAESDVELIKEARILRLRKDASRVQLAQLALTPRELAFPRIEYVVPATAFILVALVTGFLFLREMTDTRVRTAADLMVVPEARILGVIPELEEDPCRCEHAELAVHDSPQSVLAESYRQAWALTDKAMARLGHQTLLVAGGLPQSGSTTVITNLAAAAAACGRSVVIVDANFRRPRLGAAMGLDGDGPGLGDFLMDQATAEEVIRRTDYGVHAITAGTPAHRVLERLNGARFDELMAELRSSYDVVLVDAPPAVVAGDALVLAGKVDAAVLVVRACQEQRGLVARLVNQLVDAHCELLGIVLNRPKGTAGGYFKKNFETMARYASPPQLPAATAPAET